MSTVQSVKDDDQVPTVNTTRERIISILPIPAELQKYSDVKVGFLGKSSFDSWTLMVFLYNCSLSSVHKREGVLIGHLISFGRLKRRSRRTNKAKGCCGPQFVEVHWIQDSALFGLDPPSSLFWADNEPCSWGVRVCLCLSALAGSAHQLLTTRDHRHRRLSHQQENHL